MKKIAFTTLNIVVAVAEVVGFVFALPQYGWNSLCYYTLLSNAFALGVCVFCAFAVWKNPKLCCNLYLVVCTMLTFTFVAVTVGLFVAGEVDLLFLQPSSMFHHIVCPVLAVANFLLFCNKELQFRWGVVAICATVAYGTVMIVLNCAHVVVGPYFFFDLHTNGVVATFVYGLCMIAMSYISATLVFWAKTHKLPSLFKTT